MLRWLLPSQRPSLASRGERRRPVHHLLAAQVCLVAPAGPRGSRGVAAEDSAATARGSLAQIESPTCTMYESMAWHQRRCRPHPRRAGRSMGGFSSDDPRKRGHAETQPSPFLQRAGRVEDRGSSIAFGARPVTVCWRAAQASSRSRKRLRLDGPSGPGEEAGCSLTSCGTQADGRRSVGDYARRPEHAGRRHDPAWRGRGVPGRRSRGRASRAGTEHLVYVATPLRLSAHELAQRLNDDSHDIGVRAVDLPSEEAQNGIASSFARKPLEMRPPDSHTGLARSGGRASCGPRGRQSDHKGVSHDRGGQHPEAGVRN